MPARIVAATALLIEIIDELARDPDANLGTVQGAFFMALAPLRSELAKIHGEAVKEMQELPPRIFARDGEGSV